MTGPHEPRAARTDAAPDDAAPAPETRDAAAAAHGGPAPGGSAARTVAAAATGTAAPGTPGLPRLVRTAAELRALHGPGGPRAVVMTMGALHEGHAALVRAARQAAGPDGQVVVTVFVNPLQFGPGEDLDRYPRTLDADLRLAGGTGADVVFAPAVDEVYPGGEPQVRIAAGPMGERLEGEHRPGHFDGMLTVVAKLLHLTEPDVSLYGRKDAQQLALIRRMVRDLNFPVEIAGVPTVREPDGLARSSRNAYLAAGERHTALALSRALFAGRDAARTPPGGPAAVRTAAWEVLDAARTATPPLEPDYLALVHPEDFTEVPEDFAGEAVLAVAALVGTTRLIDNVAVEFPGRA
ncbi:pantoate--beta-alanine ligase [Streptomyces sp. JJ36]|uniref:pantoate--beta-alanine ligase n=1 Tax=Streptomyces sp. JJ36 TaxID=2736645 RepID=UPI001EFFD08A|nr:pantoate--beta-alanine ligase [Streptomyces sp. JJ36]MCF6523669.1 pantoate--beta-alanine ligase [Streptomyces sp. JJ36]